MTTGKKIKFHRLLYHLTQQQLADEIGVSQSSLSHIEGDSVFPSAGILYPLSRALNVSVEYLLGITDEFGIPIVNDANLSQEESHLLTLFRQLSYDEREVITCNIEAILNHSSAKPRID